MKKTLLMIAAINILVAVQGNYAQSIYFSQPSNTTIYTSPGESAANVGIYLTSTPLGLPWHNPSEHLWIDGNQVTYDPAYGTNWYSESIGNHTLHAELWEYNSAQQNVKIAEANLNISILPTYLLYVRNSFNAGILYVDGNQVNSGQSFGWRGGENHSITAVDNQSSGGYVRVFWNWSGLGSGSNLSISPTISQNGTFQAEFKKLCNLTFSTSYGAGTVTVQGSQHSSGYQMNLIEQNEVTFSAPSDVSYAGYYRHLTNWTAYGSPVTSPQYPQSHTSYQANYSATLIEPQSVSGSTYTDGYGTHPSISWAASEATDAEGYHVYRKYGRLGTLNFLTTISGRTNTSFIDYDINIVPGGEMITYIMRTFKSSQESQNSQNIEYWGEYGAKVAQVGEDKIFMEAAQELPTEFSLGQNYPNPFNPVTTINFTLPTTQNVRLAVYDMLGKEVALLVNGERSAGYHNVQFNARNLGSGIYIYKLQAGTFTQIKKMQLIK